MTLPAWKTYLDATDPQGRTGTLETPICAETENAAAVAAVESAQADGYTPTNGRVQVQPDGNCQH